MSLSIERQADRSSSIVVTNVSSLITSLELVGFSSSELAVAGR